MTTLREALQNRRTAELPAKHSCDVADVPVRALQIHAWNGGRWVLPWAHFSAAHHQRTGETEQLVLSFVRHEVHVEGTGLVLLLPAIAGFRLDCLRDLPETFRALIDKNEPFILRVSVHDVKDSMAIE